MVRFSIERCIWIKKIHIKKLFIWPCLQVIIPVLWFNNARHSIYTRSLLRLSFLAIVISGQFRFISDVHGLLSHSSQQNYPTSRMYNDDNAILYEIAINIASNELTIRAINRPQIARKLSKWEFCHGRHTRISRVHITPTTRLKVRTLCPSVATFRAYLFLFFFF